MHRIDSNNPKKSTRSFERTRIFYSKCHRIQLDLVFCYNKYFNFFKIIILIISIEIPKMYSREVNDAAAASNNHCPTKCSRLLTEVRFDLYGLRRAFEEFEASDIIKAWLEVSSTGFVRTDLERVFWSTMFVDGLLLSCWSWCCICCCCCCWTRWLSVDALFWPKKASTIRDIPLITFWAEFWKLVLFLEKINKSLFGVLY